MDKCKPFYEHKYRIFQDYFGKFYDITAICDTPDKETADLIVKVFTEYNKNRPFEYFIKEISYDD